MSIFDQMSKFKLRQFSSDLYEILYGGVFQYAEDDGAIHLGHKSMGEKSIFGR